MNHVYINQCEERSCDQSQRGIHQTHYNPSADCRSGTMLVQCAVSLEHLQKITKDTYKHIFYKLTLGLACFGRIEILFLFLKIMWPASFYITLPVCIGSNAIIRTNQQSKEQSYRLVIG